MKNLKHIHENISVINEDEVKKRAFIYLTRILHKVSMKVASDELRLYVPTLHRIIDEALPIESIKYLTAAHIVFMYETTNRIKQIMENAPRHNAYFVHERHARIAKRAEAKAVQS